MTERNRDSDRPAAAFEALFSALPDGLLLLEGARLRRANPQAAAWLGLPAGALEGRPLAGLLDPVTPGEEPWEALLLGKGARRPVEVRRLPWPLEGERRGERRCELLLLRDRQRISDLETLLEQGSRIARIGYWAWDLTSGLPSVCSSELAHMHELDVEDYLRLYRSHEDHLAVCHPEDRARYDRAVGESDASGEPLEVGYRMVLPSGRLLHVIEKCVYARDETGRSVRAFGILQDVTEQKRREQELLEARRAAEAANRAKSDFLAMMSHELRTPLNAVIGFSELIQITETREGGKAQTAERARAIHAAAEHLLSLINDILDLSKLEAGEAEFHPGPVEAAALERSCTAMVAAQAERQGVALQSRIEPADLVFRCDARAIQQVLVNLLSNAIRFSEAGTRVELSLVLAKAPGEARGEGSEVRLVVRDEGCGMTPGEIERALQPFAQVANVFTRRAGGTGLGLPIVKRLVGQIGGTLSFDSRPGEGTAVTVRLPFAAA